MVQKDRDQTIITDRHVATTDPTAPHDLAAPGVTASTVMREPDADAVTSNGVPIAECLEEDRVRVTGTVESVRALSRRGWPRLEVSLADGSASVALVWLGRRAIPGLEPGHRLSATGTLLRRSGRRVIYNPAYELIADVGATASR